MVTMNAAAERDAARREYNANLKQCPGHEVLATLSDKWVTLVLSALGDGPLRHGELARIVAGASQKMLTQTLRKLERDGLISRTTLPGVPVGVEYQLTELGHSILPLQRAIKAWAETHIEGIHAARARFDTKTPEPTVVAMPRMAARVGLPGNAHGRAEHISGGIDHEFMGAPRLASASLSGHLV